VLTLIQTMVLPGIPIVLFIPGIACMPLPPKAPAIPLPLRVHGVQLTPEVSVSWDKDVVWKYLVGFIGRIDGLLVDNATIAARMLSFVICIETIYRSTLLRGCGCLSAYKAVHSLLLWV
jgi:hypothetical protein